MENMQLLKYCLQANLSLQIYDRDLLVYFGKRIGRRPQVCLKLFNIYQNQEQLFLNGKEIQILPFQISKPEDYFILKVGTKTLKILPDHFFSFLAIVSDIYLPVLPLGSIVKLKNEYFTEEFPIEKNMNIQIVITDRYLTEEHSPVYFPYGGVIYPLGCYEEQQKLHFGFHLIEKIVFEGYHDELEEVFVALMKEELLLTRKLHSMSFATQEETSQIKKLIRKDTEL